MSSCWCFLFHHTLMHRLAGWLAFFAFHVSVCVAEKFTKNNYITPHWPCAGMTSDRGRIFEDFNCNFPIESRPWRGNEIRDSRCVRIGSSSWTSVLRAWSVARQQWEARIVGLFSFLWNSFHILFVSVLRWRK